MNEEYDVIVLGTGLTECVLSGLLSVDGKKVFHLDRNDYYGAECASLDLTQCFKRFSDGKEPPESYGPPRKYLIDLVPKFLMAEGTLVKILVHTDVTKYLEFQSVEGSYVSKASKKDKGLKIHKVPATAGEATKSKLMGMIEKKRFADFLNFADSFDPENPEKSKGIKKDTLTKDMLKKYKFDSNTIDFLGHALALYRDETWMELPATETLARVKLYGDSLAAYGKSPYLYPLYGLGDLPQAFARLSSVHGGLYYLPKKVDKLVYDDKGRVCGISSDGEIAKCKAVIGHPSYFPDKVKKVGQVVRCICILDGPVPNTKDANGCQIIIPQSQVGRKNDIYISCVCSTHGVCPKGKWIAIVATTVETSEPNAELEHGINFLGSNVLEKFYYTSDLFEPTNDPSKDGVFITNSIDATTHFETISKDVLRVYKAYAGKELVLKPKKQES